LKAVKQFRKLILASALTITGFASAYAGGAGYGAPLDSSSDLTLRVKNMIHIPAPAVGELQGEVDLVFRVNANGRLEVLSASCDHQQVLLQLKEDLDNAKVNVDRTLTGKTYKMSFRYSSRSQSATAFN